MPLKTHQDPLPEMNLTPMIDIVFQLIIFFMVGTRFADMEKAVELRVPRVSSERELASVAPYRIINVLQSGEIQLDQEVVDLAELQRRLLRETQAHRSLSVAIRGDGEGPLKHVAEVLTACRDSGVDELAISVEIAPKKR